MGRTSLRVVQVPVPGIRAEAERSAIMTKRKRRTWTRVAPDVDAYTIAICVAVGFLDGWPIEITRDGARAIRRGDVIGEAERRTKQT
jgi:hypothetical protein